jgi:tetratricopeptide (TPR) repeat protein
LLAGDSKVAVKQLHDANEREARPAHAIGLADALASSYAWDDAVAALDHALNAVPDHPGAAIARAAILARAGRVSPGSSIGNETRAQLERVLADAQKPAGQQKSGLSQAQIAFAHLALARLDFARGDGNAVRTDIAAALAVRDDDQRFAEEAVDTLYSTGQFDVARRAAELAIAKFPQSKRARLVLAEIVLAQGRAIDALDILSKQADITTLPLAQAVRGQAHLANADYESARTDFEAALKKLPTLEPAIVGRAWVQLATGDVDAAKRAIEAVYNAKTASAALATVYAAILRRTNAKDARDKAKAILDKIVATQSGLDLSRAHLELARIDRDLGNFREAGVHFAEASKSGNIEARVENGMLQIDFKDPTGGRETLDGVLKSVGDHPSASLLIDVARARMLVGDHAGAVQLLDRAEKTAGVEKWKLDRERGRLALRKDDIATASAALSRALDTCGDDTETFLIAADVTTGDFEKQGPLVEKTRRLATARLGAHPGELHVAEGKMFVGAGKYDEAERAFMKANDVFMEQKSPPRLQAQAYYGLALLAYYRNEDQSALDKLEVVTTQDPSLYFAYQAVGTIQRERKPRLALEQFQKAVAFDPDLVAAWVELGKLASKLGDRPAFADATKKLEQIAPEEAKELAKLKR